MRITVTEPKALDTSEMRSNAAGGTAQHHRRSKSHSDSVGTQPTKLARVSGGLRRPVSSDSLQSLEVATPKTNNDETITSIPFAQRGMGALAACLLAGSCVQDMVEDPELGMLLVSGHADVLSAKVCGLPRGLKEQSLDMGDRQAPEVSSVQKDVSTSDNDIDDLNDMTQNSANKPNSVVDEPADASMPSPRLGFARSTSTPIPQLHQANNSSMPSTGPSEKKARVSMRALRTGSGENRIMEFLRANSSPKADEASCLASSSIDEAPKIRITPVTRYIRPSRYAKANRLATNEILGSLEEDGLIPRGRQTVSRRTSQRPPSLS